MKSSILALTLLISHLDVVSQKKAPLDKGLLWEVSGNGLKKPSYLLGTFHLANYTFLDSIPGAREKFINSELLITEIQADSNGLIIPDFSGVYMEDTTISQLLTPEQYERFSYLTKNWMNMDAAMLNKIRPGFVMAFLTEAMMMRVHSQDRFTQKMDMGLMKDAATMEKKTAGLETMSYQMSILKYLGSLERQAQQLAEFISDTSKAKQELLTLYSKYRKGDLSALYAMSKEQGAGMTDAELNQLLLVRNEAWLKLLPAHFKSASCFVAVGALHLAGPDGLIARLRKMGYTVKAVG